MPVPYADHHTSNLAVCTGLPSGVVDSLIGIAERIRSFPDGDFLPSPPPVLLDKLTDQLLVVASDAVTTVASQASPPLSGKAKLRLLAWVVADARRGGRPIEKALAETVGKRLEKQAQKVRETLASASAHAADAREAAHAAAAQDATLAATLRATLADIDATEHMAYVSARDEVYVGFHELGSDPKPPKWSLAVPTYMTDIPPLEESDIPPSLGDYLDKEGADFLRNLGGLVPSDLQPDGLPYVVGKLVNELMIAERYKETYRRQAEGDRAEAQLQMHQRHEAEAAVEKTRVEAQTQLEEAQEENARLEQELLVMRGKLAWEKGSVSALHKVINETLAKHMAVEK